MTTPPEVWVRRSLRACLPGLSQNNLNLVSNRSTGSVQNVAGQLNYRGRLHAHGSKPPGLQIPFQVNHGLLLIQVEHVDRKAHGEGVDSARRNNPQAPSSMETTGFGPHQASK